MYAGVVVVVSVLGGEWQEEKGGCSRLCSYMYMSTSSVICTKSY